MFGGQGGFHPPPPPPQHQGFPQGQHRSGPPPAKKPKGNPIITRYAPPPGYKGPAQPQPQPPNAAHVHRPSWPHPPQPQGYGQAAQPPQQSFAYGEKQLHAASQWSSYPQTPYGQQQYPLQPFTKQEQLPYQQHPPHQQYPPQQQHAPLPIQAQQFHQQQSQYGHLPTTQQPAPNWQTSSTVSTPHSVLAQEPFWTHLSTTCQPAGPHSGKRSNSAAFSAGRSRSNTLVDGNGETLSAQGDGGFEEHESEYTRECHYLRHPDDIDEQLSLGDILWKPALPTRRALPSTFAEAELDALAPRTFKFDDGGIVSDYFIGPKKEEAFLSVRQTDGWHEIKDDPIFKEFRVFSPDTLTLSELLDAYKDRPDPSWSALSAPSVTPEPEEYDDDERVSDVADGSHAGPRNHYSEGNVEAEDAGEEGDVLGRLERALQHSDEQTIPQHRRASAADRHSRASSVASTASARPSNHKPIHPVRDTAQESMLAALGVTGSPKMVYQTPGPALGAPPSREGSTARSTRENSLSTGPGADSGQSRPLPPSREGSTARSTRENSRSAGPGAFSGSLRQWPPPPPPGPPPQYRSQSFQSHGLPYSNGFQPSRPGSSNSQYTAAGSDFHPFEDDEATPKPQRYRDDGRKRRFDESDGAAMDRAMQLDDGETPKQRRKQPKIEDSNGYDW